MVRTFLDVFRKQKFNVMSRIEELVYSAHEYGQRDKLFEKVSELRSLYPGMQLDDLYDEAYAEVMKTR